MEAFSNRRDSLVIYRKASTIYIKQVCCTDISNYRRFILKSTNKTKYKYIPLKMYINLNYENSTLSKKLLVQT